MYSIDIAKRGALLGAVAFTLLVFAHATVASAQPGATKPATKPDDKTKPKADPPPADPTAQPKADPTTPPAGDPNGGTTPPGNGATPPPGNGTTPPPGDGSTPPGNGSSDPNAGTPKAGAENTDAVPINLRLRQLEQRVQALKERAWRAKARVGMLKEAVLGGGIGARATIMHKNKMGGSFRLLKLIYALDGTQIFARNSESGTLPNTMDVLTGPIAPGSHTISVFAIYRGHGYGVFKYLNKYRFRVRSSHTFTASEGKDTRIEVVGFERGGATTPLEKRPAVDFKVTQSRGGGK